MEPENFLNPVVLAYLVIIAGAQIGLAQWRRRASKRLQARRHAAGLPDGLILNTTTRLETIRQEALVEAGVLLGTVVFAPFLLWAAAHFLYPTAKEGLGLVFAALLIWVLFTGSDVGKAFLGGLSFRTLLAFNPPFQVGDRVTLNGHAGKVTDIGLFHVRLVTPDDDLVSIPTAGLWGETLVSANAGDRASLCVMPFHLAPFATKDQRQRAEDALWDAIQASTFFDFTKPMQIYVDQTENAIGLTAKAYVANTYNEPLFKSDVARTFLDWAADSRIPLASTRWREERRKIPVRARRRR